MKTLRRWFGATAVGEKIYIAGGHNRRYMGLSSAEVFDSVSKKWSQLPDMDQERWACAVTSVNGNI